MIETRWSHAAAAAAPAIFVLLWSTGFIGAKFGMPYVEPFTFLGLRMIIVVVILGAVVLMARVGLPSVHDIGHSAVVGTLIHVTYLGGVFVAISQGVPAGISALIPGLQPIVTSTIANRFMGEPVTFRQWQGLALGLVGVALVLHDRSVSGSGTWLGWCASLASLLGITFGTLYQKRFGGTIDWRVGNLVQYATASILFWLVALLFETRVIHWSGELVFALAWLVLVLSLGAVGLMYWLIRRSAATGFASLFYLVPGVTAILAFFLFGERLDVISVAGMAVCAFGVLLVSRTEKPAAPVQTAAASD